MTPSNRKRRPRFPFSFGQKVANKQKMDRFTCKGLICSLHCARQQEEGDKQDNSLHGEDKMCSTPIGLELMDFSTVHNYKSTKFKSINAEKIVSFVFPLFLTASEEKHCNNKVLHLTYLCFSYTLKAYYYF